MPVMKKKEEIILLARLRSIIKLNQENVGYVAMFSIKY